MSITKTNADLEAIPVESVAPLLHPNEATIEASMVAAREDTLLDEVFASIEEAAARVLSPREAHVFNGRYRRVPPASLKELAAELRVGESRVSQISRRACEKIREAFDAGELIGLTAEGEAEAERLLAQRKRKAAA